MRHPAGLRLLSTALFIAPLAACGGKSAEPTPHHASASASANTAPTDANAAKPAATSTKAIAAKPAGTATVTAAAATAVVKEPELPALPPPTEGKDFAAEAKLLFRVAACSGNAELPPSIDAKVVEEHCKLMRPMMEQYKKTYLGEARDLLLSTQPKDLPTTVVYPFGGGDLLSALTTYPKLREVTTLSLEYAGDPRRLAMADKKSLEKALALFRKTIDQLLTLTDSASDDLMRTQQGVLPGQLSFFLVGLAIHGYEPTSLRYVSLEKDGSLHYLDEKDIAKLEPKKADKLNPVWKKPDFSLAFSNQELRFKKAGALGEGDHVHRHFAINLDDVHLRKDPSIITHLSKKGEVASMVKAASYLLWGGAFTEIRDYLLQHVVFMLSDSTGIPPEIASKAGFTQETYGMFEGTFIPASPKVAKTFEALWKSQPERPLAFRFGYGDVKKRPHLMVTRKNRAAKSP